MQKKHISIGSRNAHYNFIKELQSAQQQEKLQTINPMNLQMCTFTKRKKTCDTQHKIEINETQFKIKNNKCYVLPSLCIKKITE